MNYFEHHIGDYDEATSHLSACEDGIYCRLIRKYFATERPLVADVPKLQRLVRAKSREEKQAVVDVLEEFFHLEEDGYHQHTCDEVLAKFHAGEPEREVKKANEDNRLKRHRDERAKLFKLITDAGKHAPWNIGITELRAMADRLPETTDETHPPPLPATAPATPATATQTPVPTTHPPLPIHQGIDTHTSQPTEAGSACLAMKRIGLSDVNPGHPDLAMLIAAGATLTEFEGAARAALDKGKGYLYALGVVKGQRKDAADAARGIHRGPLPLPPASKQTALEQRNAAAAAEFLERIDAGQ